VNEKTFSVYVYFAITFTYGFCCIVLRLGFDVQKKEE
jgi:hypothetical protein